MSEETATLPAQSEVAAPVLECATCNRVFTTKSGLTIHMKVCSDKEANKAQQPQDTKRVPSYGHPTGNGSNGSNGSNGYMNGSRDREQPREQLRDQPRADGREQPRADGQFSVGEKAFIMYPDHVAMMLDINFCIALADYILQHGSPNKAIVAFGHQLRRLDSD